MLGTLVLLLGLIAIAEGDDGKWSTWGAWSKCTATCGTGLQVHTRSCNSPRPGPGDAYCVGDSLEVHPCDEEACPTAGMWSEWSLFSACSVTCNTGVKTRTHQCNTPPPGPGGAYCVGDAQDTSSCNTITCPTVRNGIWSTWMSWTTCSASCGGGAQSRWRNCDNPAPNHYGKQCEGRGQESKTCNDGACPAPGRDGEWSTWSGWSTCTLSCGGGMHMRTRACNNPTPDNGLDCFGDGLETGRCNTGGCPGPEIVAFTVTMKNGWRSINGLKLVPLDTSIYNHGGHFDFGSHCFRAPYKGVYSFSFSATSEVDFHGTDIHLYTTKSGRSKVQRARALCVSNNQAGAAATVILQLDRGETAALWGWMTALWTGDGPNYEKSTLFSGILLHKL